jgi:hypothetical protein
MSRVLLRLPCSQTTSVTRLLPVRYSGDPRAVGTELGPEIKASVRWLYPQAGPALIR